MPSSESIPVSSSSSKLTATGIIRCNVCDELIQAAAVARHVAGRDHSIRRKVAEFNEMNIQFKPSYRNDISVVSAWIRDLYKYDFLSTGGR